MQITINNLITEIIYGLDYNEVDKTKIRILIDKFTSLQDDYLALGKKHLELEARYKLLYERTKNER